ncbi:MAG: hypothetical protein JST51_03790 [Armatimonadetes bacterium]|nr:hypothetical protein [Armatimonadota bacterium]
MSLKKRDKCGYCGERASEDEHVIPECLLLDKSKKLIIRSCSKCNQAKSKDDVYLRDTFALRIETSDLAELSKIKKSMENSIERAFLPDPKIGPAFAMLKTFRQHVLPSGELQFQVTADSARMHRALHWIVRGLHFHHLGAIMNPEGKLQLWAYDLEENQERFNKIWPNTNSEEFSVGGCLRYKYIVTKTLPTFSNWQLYFYERVYFIVSINEHLWDQFN